VLPWLGTGGRYGLESATKLFAAVPDEGK